MIDLQCPTAHRLVAQVSTAYPRPRCSAIPSGIGTSLQRGHKGRHLQQRGGSQLCSSYKHIGIELRYGEGIANLEHVNQTVLTRLDL